MKILHLSDLHFKQNNVAQDVVLSSLLRFIKELISNNTKPDVVVITGDIAYSGKAEEYLTAQDFFTEILKHSGLDSSSIYFIPGNHDVDRNKIKPEHIGWWYNFKDEKELNANLNSDDSFPKIIAKKSAYFDFAKKHSNGFITYGKFGEYVCSLTTPNQFKYNLKLVGLNSAIFCGYDGDDKAKLALGLEQVNKCESEINSKEEIIITCIHHPKECFHSCEKPTLVTLERFSDLILSGHVHEASNCAKRDGNTGETVYISAGSSYETRESQNGFNLIDIDIDNLKGEVSFFKYLPNEHKWIQNKDINTETNGVFPFIITKQSIQPPVSVSATSTSVNKQYSAVVDIKYDELNRTRVEALLEHLVKVTGDEKTLITKLEKGSVKIYFETSADVSEAIKEQLLSSKELPIKEIKAISDADRITIADKSVFHWRTFLKPEFTKNIENPGAAFIHGGVDEIKLKDLYVSPNLKTINLNDRANEKVEKVGSSDSVLQKKSGVPLKVVIYGADYSGKSTLTRWWYEKYYDAGYIPILVSGSSFKDIRKEKIKKHIEKEFAEQYFGMEMDGHLDNYDQDRIILIIDDFHRVRFAKPKFKANLISNICKCYQNILITGHDVMQYEAYTYKAGYVKNILDGFDRYQIIEFGPRLRYELIKKWNALGADVIDKNELIRINTETEKHVESIIGKNFVPSFPVYLLTILQSREAGSSQNPEYSLHGFYYELLINEALNRAVENKNEISLYYNFITDYCYFLFESNIRMAPLLKADFTKFFDNYCKEYKVSKSINEVFSILTKSKLLKVDGDGIAISFKYVYYFFVAKYLANNISQEETRNKVGLLCERTHRDEFASIIMFLTHLSKDQFILNKLLENSKAQFNAFAPIKMEDDIAFINEMVKKLPQQVYEPVDVEQIKEEELKEEEELNIQEREFDDKNDIYNYDINEDISTLDVLSKITKAVKTIEILGQVTKKYWGELKAQQKFDLAEETYMLGLRTLGFYFGVIKQDPESIVEYLKHIYRKKHGGTTISKEEIDTASRNYLFGICVMSSLSIIKRVGNSIGYENLSGTFEDIAKAHDYNSVKLIDASIKLDHDKKFPIEDIRKVKEDTGKNFLSSIVLKNLVINYLYVFYTSIEDKQKICALLDIKIEQQRMIDATSAVKRETGSSVSELDK